MNGAITFLCVTAQNTGQSDNMWKRYYHDYLRNVFGGSQLLENSNFAHEYFHNIYNSRNVSAAFAALQHSFCTHRWSVYPDNRTFSPDAFRGFAVLDRVATDIPAGCPDVGVTFPMMNKGCRPTGRDCNNQAD